MALDSNREVAARVERALVAGVHRPGLRAEVSVSDLRHLLTLLKFYGGRRDWSPDEPGAIERLPGPVRRYIRALESALEQADPGAGVARATAKSSHGAGGDGP